MDYVEYKIDADEEEQEILIALLSEWPLDSFVQNPGQLSAFIPSSLLTPVIKSDIESFLQKRDRDFKQREIPHENWNAKWESEFEPIVIPGKCIVRAPFHTASPNLPMEIIIQPKMAFGTGHHATTYLMMERMFELDFKGKTVLDYGCGTGILSILASKLGAIEVFAVDNDPLAVENCLEQLALNNVLNAKVIQNDTPELDNQKFSCILANINRNVLQAQMKALSNRLLPSGILLISGIFEQDSGTMKGLLKEHGFSEIQSSDKDGWVCIEAKN